MMGSQRCDLSFENVKLSVRECIVGRGRKRKEILRGVSGEFRGGRLTAIFGQSGSGKTSLLNILTGFTRNNVSGAIKINGNENICAIRKRSKYIMQDYSLQHFITVREAMNFAANLKLLGVSRASKTGKTVSILCELGLEDKMDHYTGDLSGGESKRLTIALELLDDPAILFLDEPTTGLDSSSSTQCIQLLKKLTSEGKTIICTIHTPSALLFDMLDHLYVLAEGRCIYQGPSRKLLSFLHELDLICPENYNPADYLLEIANNDYGEHNHRLTEKIGNGSNCFERPSDDDTLDANDIPTHQTSDFKHSSHLISSFINQLKQLLLRNYLTVGRDRTLCLMRIFIHVIIAVFIGIMYSGIGNDAANLLNIYKFLFFNIFVLMFTSFSSLQTSFPLNFPATKREHFNGWYTTAAYYFALTIADLPVLIASNLIYIVITYLMTSQPMELSRFISYCIVILLLSLAAQGLGLVSGSLMNVKFTLILGSFFMCPFVLFSNFFVQMRDTQPIWHWIFELSFIKHALEGSMQAIIGGDRAKLSCNEDYCHWKWPNKFLDYVGITESLPTVMLKLAAFAFVFRAIAFVTMWYRLKH